jgi:cytochrome b subunit of formate dehydrogenase
MATHDKDTVLRHAGIDRLFHWLTAAVMIVLLATSLLPILGVQFAWVDIHWIAGVILTALILLHAVRALFWQSPRSMAIRGGDFGELQGQRLPGKYSLAQKLMHLGWLVAILVAIVTGWFLMKKVGVPFFERNPYAFSLRTWGVMTLLHGLAALLSVFLILVHVYFGLLPEKRQYLRAMLSGRVPRAALAREHDLGKVERGE